MADNITRTPALSRPSAIRGRTPGSAAVSIPQQLAQLQTRLDAMPHASQERQQDQGMGY